MPTPTETTITTTANETIVRTIIDDVHGSRYELTTFKSGALEVYGEYVDEPGLPYYLGQWHEVGHTLPEWNYAAFNQHQQAKHARTRATLAANRASAAAA